jgi:hypothetical protein
MPCLELDASTFLFDELSNLRPLAGVDVQSRQSSYLTCSDGLA